MHDLFFASIGYSFNKYLLATNYVLSIILDVGGKTMMKKVRGLALTVTSGNTDRH